MKTPADIIDTLGRERVAAALGVSHKRVTKARHELLPALWFDVLEGMAGHPLPRSCFSFHRHIQAAE